MMGLTERGRRVAAAAVLVSLFGGFVRDVFLVALGVLAAAFLVYSYVKLGRELDEASSLIQLSPERFEASFTAGEEYSSELSVVSDSGRLYRLSFPVGSVGDGLVGVGANTLSYVFKPDLSANYVFEEAKAEAIDPYGLLRGEAALDFKVSFKVFPRVVSVAVEALTYLEGRGIQGAGEQTSSTKGNGYEYADSREYVPGDSFRKMDWKATARLGKLIVKEYYTESSGAVHILYENRAPDPVSSDVLRAAYLQAVLSFAERGWVMGLTVLDGGKVSAHHVDLHPSVAVTRALQHVLDDNVGAVRSLYAVLDPVYMSRLRGFLDSAVRSNGELAEVKDELFKQAYGGLLYVTCLADSPMNMLEVCHAARLSGTRVAVMEPCRPWRYGGLEDAYTALDKYDRVNRGLEKQGVPVAVGLEEALDVFREAPMVAAR